MARIILAPGDNPDGPGRVSVDGDARSVDLSALPAGTHVVKWNGVDGVIEWNVPVVEIDDDGIARLVRHTSFTDFAPYQQYLDAWGTANDTPAPTTLAEAERQKADAMLVYRKSLQADGYRHLDGFTYEVHAGAAAVVAEILVNVTLGLPLPGSHGAQMIFWDPANVGHLHDVTSLTKLLQGLRNILQLKFERHAKHQAAVRAIRLDTSKSIAVRIADIAAYDHTTGYPDQTAAGAGVAP